MTSTLEPDAHGVRANEGARLGIATLASTDGETMARLTGAGTTVGTAEYMSPEQAAGEEVGCRSDLWSLGVVAREMLTGRPIFDGTNVLAIMRAVMTTTPDGNAHV